MSYIQYDSGLLRNAEKSPTWPGCDDGFRVPRRTVMLIARLLFSVRAVLLGKRDVGDSIHSTTGAWESGGQICWHFSLQVHKKFRWTWREGRKEWLQSVYKSEVISPLLNLVPLSEVSKACGWRVNFLFRAPFYLHI